MSAYKHTDQRGMVSIMITLIMMIVISLIVTGFVQVSNRNRREALDRQLSMQAFYAAESGVNAVYNAIRSHPGTVDEQGDCDGSSYPTPGVLSTEVAYTCVLVDSTVPNILTSASTEGSTIVRIDSVDDSGGELPASSLSFSWSPPQGISAVTSGCPTVRGTFPVNGTDYNDDCSFGLLRVDLFRADGAFTMDPNGLAGNTVTFYMQPVGTATPAVVSDFTGTKAFIVGASYNSGMYTGTINLDSAARGAHYYARITTLYRNANSVVIDANSSTAHFANMQAQVDVTGKAQDVLRRVQVRIPLQYYGDSTPVGVVQSSSSVCKRFSISDTSYNNTECESGP